MMKSLLVPACVILVFSASVMANIQRGGTLKVGGHIDKRLRVFSRVSQEHW